MNTNSPVEGKFDEGSGVRAKAPIMEVKYPNCAGIDIAKSEHWVALPADVEREHRVRKFGGYTKELRALSSWLKQNEIEQVAMEATGFYWIAPYELLDRDGFDVWLVNPQQTKRRDQRKSDALDCQWIQQLMSYGLLNASHRPQDEVCELRSYVRTYQRLMRDRGRYIQKMQKSLHEMNIHLDTVLSDISGMSGMRIIDAILSGERDGDKLAKLCDVRVKASEQEVSAALEGNWRCEHLFALQQAVDIYRTFSGHMEKTKIEIDRMVQQLTTSSDIVESGAGERMEVGRKDLRCPARTVADQLLQLMLWQVFGVDLTAIPGVGVQTALVLLSEVGPDFSRFRTSGEFCSWLALAPNVRVSGGKRLSGRGPHRTHVAGQALRMAAMSLRRSQCYEGERHRARCLRLDTQRAIKASAHRLARVIYSMVKYGHEYIDPGMEKIEEERRAKNVRRLRKTAKSLGFEVVPLPKAA